MRRSGMYSVDKRQCALRCKVRYIGEVEDSLGVSSPGPCSGASREIACDGYERHVHCFNRPLSSRDLNWFVLSAILVTILGDIFIRV